MIEKIKSKISDLKNDKKSFLEYVRSFVKIDKAKILYKDNVDFKKLEMIAEDKH
jgi:hypothetical protein